MGKHFVKIQNSQLSIDRMYLLIDRNHEENFNKHSGWLDRFSIPIRSIEKANSIDRKEFSISRNFNKFITNSRVDSKDSRLLFDRLKRNIRSIEGNSQLVETRETEFSQNFHQAVFNGFSWTNYHHMNIIDWVWDQNWIPLML